MIFELAIYRTPIDSLFVNGANFRTGPLYLFSSSWDGSINQWDLETDQSKFKNVEQGNLEVAIDTLDSWARNIEMEGDVKLLNNGHGGRKTELNLYDIFRGDMETRSTYFNNMMKTGSMTPNQIRIAEGMSPYDDGDRYYIATNNFTPVDKMDDVIDSQIKRNTSSGKTENSKKLEDAALNYLKGK